MKSSTTQLGHVLGALILVAACAHARARAQESTSALVHRGLDLSKLDPAGVALNAQTVTISPQMIAIDYQLANSTAEPVTTLLVLPLPDLDFSDPDVDWSIPSSDPINFTGLMATIDRKPASFSFKQSALVGHKDVSAILRQNGLAWAPLAKFRGQLALLPPQVRAELANARIIAQFGTDRRGNPHYIPAWTVKTTATRSLVLAPGQSVTVELRYRPSVGVMRDSPLREPLRSQKEFALEVARRQAEYCADRAFLRGVDKIVSTFLAEKAKALEAAAGEASLSDPPGSAEQNVAPMHRPRQNGALPSVPSVRVFPIANEANIREWRIAYDLAAGAPGAPIKDFRLVVDKVKPDRVASFCLDNLKRISPSAFELRAANFTPSKTLQILLVGRE